MYVFVNFERNNDYIFTYKQQQKVVEIIRVPKTKRKKKKMSQQKRNQRNNKMIEHV